MHALHIDNSGDYKRSSTGIELESQRRGAPISTPRFLYAALTELHWLRECAACLITDSDGNYIRLRSIELSVPNIADGGSDGSR